MPATVHEHAAATRSRRSDFWSFWVAGVASFVLVCVVPGSPLFGERFDAPSLQSQAEEIASGRWPYREVDLEYQPAAIPPLVLPAIAPGIGYGTAFKLVECAAMIILLAGAAAIMSAGRRSRRDGILLSALIGASPILLGGLALNRFDLWPAAFTSVSIALLVHRRHTASFAVLAIATMIKLYPAVLLPALILAVLARAGRRALVRPLVAFAGVGLAIGLPFLVFAQDGLTNSVLYHRVRPLQIESLPASGMVALRLFGTGEVPVVFSYSSVNVGGSTADALATASSAATILLVAVAYWLFARGPLTTDRLILLAAVLLVAILVSSKVFSSQFVIWLLPFVLLVRGRVGAVAGLLYLFCLFLTRQVYLDYPELWELETRPSLLLILRNGVFLLLFGLLLWRLSQSKSSPNPVAGNDDDAPD
jgi:hypothetical protein